MSSQTEFEYVYYLTDSRRYPKYVGVTKDVKRRLREHINEAKSGKDTLKCDWIRAVLERGEAVQIVILETVPYGQLGDLEWFWIDELTDELGKDFRVLLNEKAGNQPKSDIDQAELRQQIAQWKRNNRSRLRKKSKKRISTHK